MNKKTITEEIEGGNFDNFARLPEKEQVKLMATWNHEMRLKYLTREPAMSEDEFFVEIEGVLEDNAII